MTTIDDLFEQEKKANKATFQENIEFLRKEHMGDYVAIRKGELFIGKTQQEALQAARAKYPDESVKQGYFFQVEEEKEPIAWELCSPLELYTK